MPAPTAADELLDFVQKSGLVEEARLCAYVQKLRETSSFPADPTKLAQLLVRDAILTYFQAEQLLQGKYKRFSLGKYKVLEKLGSGGMGTVFLCEHKLMRRRVAVKVLPVPKAEDKASLDRFYREARAVAAVDHPNIVRAYDIDQDDNLHFLVMEWVDGTNLQDLVKKFGPLDITRSCHYIYGAAVGLQHAHEIGLIHRDIKPGNILVDRSGVVKVLDLGLARLTNDADDNLTRQNDENVLGTADYLAPEQAMDSHTVDIRADIYSLGATLYFLLTGSALFPEGSIAQKLIWHQNRPPRSVKALRSEVPDELVAVLDRMLAKDVAKRYQTPSEVMTALARWVASPIPPPAEREMPTLSPAVAGGAGGRTPNAGPTLAGPASLAGGSARPHPFAGQPTFATAATAITTATPPPTAPAGPEPAVWSTLDDDTQTAARDNTVNPEPAELPPSEDERPSRVARRQPSAGGGKGKVLILALVGALVLGGTAAGVYFAFFNKTEQNTPTPNPGVSRKLTVSKTPGEHTFGSVREALAKVHPGDTIVITESRITERALVLDKLKHKDITIESATADGKPTVIEYAAKGGTMFDASGVEGVRLRNVEFDGKGQADLGIQVNGNSAGVTLEGVTVRNVLKTGVHLWNLAGAEGRPVTLDRVRVVLTPSSEAGVLLYATGPLDNRFVAIKNSRFEGPGRAGVRVDGPALDFEVSNNRFYNLSAGAGIVFVRPGGRPTKGVIANNTFYQMPIGLHFDCPPQEAGAYNVKVSLNYFAKTNELLKAQGPVKGLAPSNNFHDPSSKPGNPSMTSTAFAPALPPPNVAEDATFLRFPANPPTAGGKPAGAN